MINELHNKLYIIVCNVVILCLLVIPQVKVWPSSLDIRVASPVDDAEESLSNGSVNRDSSDLDMVYSETEQIVGIRFQNVTVPHAVVITNAYIEFETGEKGNETTNLTFKGEASDNSHFFRPLMKDISNRPTTTASVNWNNILPWDTVNEKQQTPDLSPVVQEIIDRPEWSGGNAMAFIISGTGKRTVKSYDRAHRSAPLLHIEYQSDSMDIRIYQSSDDGEERTDGSISLYSKDLNLVHEDPEHAIGIRFQNVDVPQGALINTAYLAFEASETKIKEATLTIKGEADDDASTFSNSIENITKRTITQSAISWNPIPSWNIVGEIHRTPDISPIVQEIVGRSGWSRKNAMVFIITGSGRRVVASHDGNPEAGPMLHIEYTERNLPYISVDKNTLRNVCYQSNDTISDRFILINTGSDALRYIISDDKNWISCSPEMGRLTIGGSITVTVNYNIASLNVGIHEGTIKVSDPSAPNTPHEIDVSIIVQPLRETASCGHTPVYTENLVNPAILILLDLSYSMKTLISISDPAENPRTPNLKTIVQEIIDRPGWKQGNAMAFIIAGRGHRTAESYNGTSASAPLFHLEYNYLGRLEETDIRVSHSSDDAEEKHTGNVSLASTDLELVNDKGSDQTIGIRFRNIPIPKDAVITNAFIEFVANESQSEPTSLAIRGEALDNPPAFSESYRNITGRTLTHAYVSWNNIPEWIVSIKQSMIDIARSVISDLVADKGITWAYGTWCSRGSFGYTSDIDYTKIHIGCKSNESDHQKNLQNSINSTSSYPLARTPFAHSIYAAKKYFLGHKKDKGGIGDPYKDIACQPKFLINITDGLGNVSSTDTLIRQYVGELCDIGVTPIAVGFGLNDATQIQTMAQVSNERGHSSNNIYVIHDELNAIGQPFLAYSRDALIENLARITERIKAQRFHGSAPIITTSSDHGDIFTVAEFDATDWSGDLVAYTYNNKTRGWNSIVWRASEAMPLTRKVFIVDPSAPNRVISYNDSVLANDNWLCKDIGDIINSSPIIVGNPPFCYTFDGYKKWKNSISRDPIVYVGANDGALHAFSLFDGSEQWAFFPKSSHAKLDKADDPIYDLCSNDYCHQFFVNGSPQVGDIYTGTSWMTILICGLREGGEAYFALDITYGRPFGETGGSEYLWEFTDPEMGQTWADPSIDRVKDGTGTVWGVFLGSGYAIADHYKKEAYLYGIVSHNKAPLWNNGSDDINRIKISSKTLKDDALSAPLVADLDADYIGDRIYVGNLYGTMYRIVDIGKTECPKISKLFDFSQTLHINPIRAKATYAYAADDGSIWVYFGTGMYETQTDKSSMTQQYLFGLKDKISSITTYSLDKLVKLHVKKIEYRDIGANVIQPVKIVEGENGSKRSWALLLESSSPELIGSERVIEQPLVVAGTLFFSSFVPDQDICTGNGDTWIYALDYETGMPPITPVFDLNKDSVCDDKDRVIDERGIKHNIAAIYVGTGLGSKPVFYKDTLFITTTNKKVIALKVNLPETMATLTSWKDNTI